MQGFLYHRLLSLVFPRQEMRSSCGGSGNETRGKKHPGTGFSVGLATRVGPVEPVESIAPVEPVEPVEHTEPVEPIEPVEPVESVKSTSRRRHNDVAAAKKRAIS